MAQALLLDELWSLIEAHLPVHHPSPKGGRLHIDDRAALTGILFVLKTGISWEYLPRELGSGSGMSEEKMAQLPGTKRAFAILDVTCRIQFVDKT